MSPVCDLQWRAVSDFLASRPRLSCTHSHLLASRFKCCTRRCWGPVPCPRDVSSPAAHSRTQTGTFKVRALLCVYERESVCVCVIVCKGHAFASLFASVSVSPSLCEARASAFPPLYGATGLFCATLPFLSAAPPLSFCWLCARLPKSNPPEIIHSPTCPLGNSRQTRFCLALCS